MILHGVALIAFSRPNQRPQKLDVFPRLESGSWGGFEINIRVVAHPKKLPIQEQAFLQRVCKREMWWPTRRPMQLRMVDMVWTLATMPVANVWSRKVTMSLTMGVLQVPQLLMRRVQLKLS
jgi:hypothetical protein